MDGSKNKTFRSWMSANLPSKCRVKSKTNSLKSALIIFRRWPISRQRLGNGLIFFWPCHEPQSVVLASCAQRDTMPGMFTTFIGFVFHLKNAFETRLWCRPQKNPAWRAIEREGACPRLLARFHVVKPGKNWYGKWFEGRRILCTT